jgi:NAD(P) transhydrogenase subunit alpha
VRRLSARGCSFQVERGAGAASGYPDEAYEEAGATLVDAASAVWAQSDVVMAVQAADLVQQRPELEQLPAQSVLLGLMEPHGNEALKGRLQERRLQGLALELLPRISRAQSMDVLSSQANIAGYKAVLLAASALDRYVPMLMTAAGTIQPARALILGAGVAGLQALATARRLGAVAYVSDVRAAAKEQVESLGGRFVDPPELEQKPGESGGYAQQASERFLSEQRRQLTEQLALADMVICTAQVPGRPAPRLIEDAMLTHMRPGSVVVDLAVAQGGNCEGTQPGTTVLRHGVQLIGADQLPCSVGNHASALYARNLAALLEHILNATPAEATGLHLDLNDEIVAGCLFTQSPVAVGGAA